MTTRVCSDILGVGGEGENEPGREMRAGGRRKDRRHGGRDWEEKGTRQGK